MSLAFIASCTPSSSSSDGVVTYSPKKEDLIQAQPQAQPARKLLYSSDSSVSYCESALGSNQNYSGYRDHKLYPSASVSKVFLTAFALSRLGTDYKFTHDWRLRKNTDGTVDAYLNSNFDPVFNIEKVLYTMSHLKKYGVTKIRNLYIAKSTRVYLSVLNNPHIELDTIPVSLDQSVDNLKLIFNSANWGGQTQQARQNVTDYFEQQGKSIDLPSSFSVSNVILDSKGEAQNTFANATQLKIQSTSLFRYLKEINLNSNNYMSDALFALLGGEAGFRKFQNEKLGLDLDSLIMKTGSGLPTEINGERVDNKATCFSVLKVMHFIKLIADQAQLDLGYILLTAGLDRGTFETDLVINKSVVLKTGRLYEVPALNLAGIVSTQKGLMVFGFLGHDFDNDNEKAMIEKRDNLLQDLLNYYKEKPMFKTLSQNEIFFL
ncbi:MAG: D-alanyl-D-alanine carboxypeptidase [Pseudobdellovibrio sp.]|nr:D-alanyl-D-alanine carboxypeptidase [Pseudobdellovibrio sp.]